MVAHVDSKRTDQARHTAQYLRHLKGDRASLAVKCDRAIERMIRTQKVS